MNKFSPAELSEGFPASIEELCSLIFQRITHDISSTGHFYDRVVCRLWSQVDEKTLRHLQTAHNELRKELVAGIDLNMRGALLTASERIFFSFGKIEREFCDAYMETCHEQRGSPSHLWVSKADLQGQLIDAVRHNDFPCLSAVKNHLRQKDKPDWPHALGFMGELLCIARTLAEAGGDLHSIAPRSTLLSALQENLRNEYMPLLSLPPQALAEKLVTREGKPTSAWLALAATGMAGEVLQIHRWKDDMKDCLHVWNALPAYYQQQYAGIIDTVSLQRQASSMPGNICIGALINARHACRG